MLADLLGSAVAAVLGMVPERPRWLRLTVLGMYALLFAAVVGLVIVAVL